MEKTSKRIAARSPSAQVAGAARPATVPGLTSQVLPPFTFATCSHARRLRVAAAHEVPVAGAGHGVAVLGVVHDEDAPPAELEARVGAVVLQQPAALAHLEVQRLRVADVVAVDEVHRQSVRERGLHGLRADQVAAVDHRLGALGFRVAHRLGERVGAVVAVRDDADFHALISTKRAPAGPASNSA